MGPEHRSTRVPDTTNRPIRAPEEAFLHESNPLGTVAGTRTVLTAWKDIANYVGKGVRTVQRWEQDFGFPVRRASNGSHRAILAIPEEIDAWVRRQSGQEQSELERLRAEVEQLQAELNRYRRKRAS